MLQIYQATIGLVELSIGPFSNVAFSTVSFCGQRGILRREASSRFCRPVWCPALAPTAGNCRCVLRTGKWWQRWLWWIHCWQFVRACGRCCGSSTRHLTVRCLTQFKHWCNVFEHRMLDVDRVLPPLDFYSKDGVQILSVACFTSDILMSCGYTHNFC